MGRPCLMIFSGECGGDIPRTASENKDMDLAMTDPGGTPQDAELDPESQSSRQQPTPTSRQGEVAADYREAGERG
jgi:hypothetical protein